MEFRDADIQDFWEGTDLTPRRVPSDVRKALMRKLQILDAACALDDLKIPGLAFFLCGQRNEGPVGLKAGT